LLAQLDPETKGSLGCEKEAARRAITAGRRGNFPRFQQGRCVCEAAHSQSDSNDAPAWNTLTAAG
jgi:hypothetical protein